MPSTKDAPQAKPTLKINEIKPFTNVVFNVLVGVFAISCILPFFFVVSISFTEEDAISGFGYRLFHSDFSLDAYRYLFRAGGPLLRSFGISVLITAAGTVYTVMQVSMYAYALFRKTFAFKKFFSFYVFFTMIFSGGLVPTYLLWSRVLNLDNTIWVLILVHGFNPFWVFIFRTFYKTTIHDSLIDAATIEGSTELRTYWKIAFPLSLPAIATLGLFTALTVWNDWFTSLLYIQDPNLIPLQYFLMKIERQIEFLTQAQNNMSLANLEQLRQDIPAESVRNAITVVVVLPIALTYPFFQRYFVKGLTIGSIKG